MQIPELSNDIRVSTRDTMEPAVVGRATGVRPLYEEQFTRYCSCSFGGMVGVGCLFVCFLQLNLNSLPNSVIANSLPE